MRRKKLRLAVAVTLTLMVTRLWIFTDEGVSRTVAGSLVYSNCDVERLTEIESNFQRMVEVRGSHPELIPGEEYKAAALLYIASADSCYHNGRQASLQANHGNSSGPILIDDGGAWAPGFGPPPGSAEYNTFRTKWGADSPFSPSGQNIPGPGSSGGLVTYSYMADGVSHTAEGASPNVDVRTGLGVNNCVKDEIAGAFAAWSAVADINFTEVADNGLPSNTSGAQGDIRIGAHAMDGPSNTLAHAYYPPPNGDTIAGDLHFDRDETWSCTPNGGIDIGIVALHEIGHSIGLGHETSGDTAIMNPYYNSSLTGLQDDDIDGAVSIYGTSNILNLEMELSSTSVITSFSKITYSLQIDNISSSQSVTDVVISDKASPQITYVVGSAVAKPSIVDFSNFPTETHPFSISFDSNVVITFALNVGEVNRGDTLTNTIVVSAPTLPQTVIAGVDSIVDPFKAFLPLILISD